MQEKINQNLDEVKVRLLQFAENQRIPKYDFYKKISVAQSNFGGSGMMSSLSSSKIIDILTIYPELNSDWLLLGKGEMLRQNTPVAAAESPSVVAYLEKNITDLRNELAQAYQTIGQLQQQLADHKEKAASQSATTIEATI